MTTKADFTEEEWETLEKGVTGAGFFMAVSDRGFFDTFKEAGALGKHMAHARESGPSTFIRDLAGTKSTGFGWRSSPQEVETETLAALGSAVQILDAKAPDEVENYRALVLDIAESVGSAAKGGEPAEAETLEKIKAAVG